MKNIFLLFFLLPFSLFLKAQYYYNDIVSTRQTNQAMKSYLVNKVLSVVSTGYDPQGMKTNDFSEQQDVLQNGTLLKTITSNNNNITIVYSRFDDQTRLINVTDSESYIKTTTLYSYDAGGRITTIKNTTRDTSNQFNDTEIHQWVYNQAGQVQKMLRIINEKDTTEFRFHLDENGNVIDEQSFRKGIAGELIYYYYDDKNRLTDVVRYNEKYKKLLPDFMFEYDEEGHVLQKTTLLSNLSLGYLIWRYVYDDKGLKTKEALFDKEKQMTGKIEYTYSFSQ